MSRFFKTKADIYESIRIKMDSGSAFPSSEAVTWFTPASQSPKDAAGNCLIAAIDAIAEEFEKMNVDEISEEEYRAAISAPWQ